MSPPSLDKMTKLHLQLLIMTAEPEIIINIRHQKQIENINKHGYIGKEKFAVNLACQYGPHLLIILFISRSGEGGVKRWVRISLFQPAESITLLENMKIWYNIHVLIYRLFKTKITNRVKLITLHQLAIYYFQKPKLFYV